MLMQINNNNINSECCVKRWYRKVQQNALSLTILTLWNASLLSKSDIKIRDKHCSNLGKSKTCKCQMQKSQLKANVSWLKTREEGTERKSLEHELVKGAKGNQQVQHIGSQQSSLDSSSSMLGYPGCFWIQKWPNAIYRLRHSFKLSILVIDKGQVYRQQNIWHNVTLEMVVWWRR